MRAFGIYRVEVGDAVLAQLYASNNADFQSVALKYPIRIDVGHLQTVVEGDIGAHKGELGPAQDIAQGNRTAVPFMVAEARKVETDGIHQFAHRAARFFRTVVDGVARTVVARTEQQQVGMDATQAVKQAGQFREIVDVGVHVVGGNDVDFLFFGLA